MTSILWDITKQCNLNCAHCYNAEKYSSNRKIGKNLTLKESLKAIDGFKKAGINHVNFLGGEPLLYPNFLDLIKYAKKEGFKVTMATNGILLNSSVFEKMINLGVDSITISLDGVSAKTNNSIRGKGSFDKVINNLKKSKNLIKKKKIKLILGFTITKKNLNDLPKLPAFATGMGFDAIDVQYLTLDGNAIKNSSEIGFTVDEGLTATESLVKNKKDYPEIFLQVDSRPLFQYYLKLKYGVGETNIFAMRCKGSSFHYYIRSDGEMHPCGPADSIRGLSSRDQFKFRVLNIRNEDANNILNSDYFLSFFKYVNNPETYSKIKTCKVCKFNEFCTPCPLENCRDYETRMEECEWSMKKIFELKKEMLNSIYLPNLKLRWYNDKGIIRIFDFRKGDYVSLDKIASEIWLSLDGRNTENIIKELSAKYESPKVSNDVIELIAELRNNDYLYIKQVSI